MSNVQNTTTTTDAIVSPPVTTEDPSVIPENMNKDDAKSVDTPVAESKTQDVSADEQLKDEAAAVDRKEESPVTEKIVESISEGQLTYKAPGLLK